MSSAGFQLVAGRIPGERIETTVRTSNSATTGATEIVTDTVVASVVAGRTYGVVWHARTNSTVAGDDVRAQIREDSVSGRILIVVDDDISVVGRQPRNHMYAEYTADATEDKTFVATVQRLAGSGDVFAPAGSTQPTYLYVDYIRG